ncbi:MAG: NAD(P)H-dependent oxidoreductase [Gammaproteobacteria bacterium]|jgi:NAD(P)H-dependent FMN reductase|nr:NAD(P)H-dependent oxidoreductase [Gammaproteobacteria bacterium]
MRTKVTCFAASSSRSSINRQFVTCAAGLVEDAEVEILDLNDFELPLFSVDREAELGQPQPAQEFLDKIHDSDALIISFAEHNGCYSAAYKNLYDWMSRIEAKVYKDKKIVLLATSPGGRGGQSVLELALVQIPRFGGDIRGCVSMPNFYENFDSERGVVNNSEIATELKEAIQRLLSDD